MGKVVHRTVINGIVAKQNYAAEPLPLEGGMGVTAFVGTV